MSRIMSILCVSALATLTMSATTVAQEENPDYRIRASFRNESNESVGNAEFRVKSRFLKVYYGGVSRNDEFRFVVGLDNSSFANRDFDVYLDDIFVGRSTANEFGLLDDTYRSDWKPDDLPDRQLPEEFPDPAVVGMSVSVYDALAGELMFSSILEERYDRGDVNQDGKVDEDDWPYLLRSYGRPGIGPAAGDFTGDSFSDAEDYALFAENWTSRDPLPSAPVLTGDANFDGRVDGSDLQIWLDHRFTQQLGAEFGDFNEDGSVDVTDFNVWNQNKLLLASPAATAAVPEPSGALWWLADALCLSYFRRWPRPAFRKA